MRKFIVILIFSGLPLPYYLTLDAKTNRKRTLNQTVSKQQLAAIRQCSTAHKGSIFHLFA